MVANRYTITNNVFKEYDEYVIEQRVINWPILLLRERVMTKLVDKKKVEVKKVNNKLKFIEFVYLSQEEYALLISGFWLVKVKTVIERLNNYIGSKWDHYKSHYHTILNWFSKNGDKKLDAIKDMKPVVEEKKEREYTPMTEEEKIKAKETLLAFRNKLWKS